MSLGLREYFARSRNITWQNAVIFRLLFVPLEDTVEEFNFIAETAGDNTAELQYYIEKLFVRGRLFRGPRKVGNPRLASELWNVHNAVTGNKAQAILWRFAQQTWRIMTVHHLFRSSLKCLKLNMTHTTCRRPETNTSKCQLTLSVKLVAYYGNDAKISRIQRRKLPDKLFPRYTI